MEQFQENTAFQLPNTNHRRSLQNRNKERNPKILLADTRLVTQRLSPLFRRRHLRIYSLRSSPILQRLNWKRMLPRVQTSLTSTLIELVSRACRGHSKTSISLRSDRHSEPQVRGLAARFDGICRKTGHEGDYPHSIAPWI